MKDDDFIDVVRAPWEIVAIKEPIVQISDLDNLKKLSEFHKTPIFRVKNYISFFDRAVSKKGFFESATTQKIIDLYTMYYLEVKENNEKKYYYFSELMNKRTMPDKCDYCHHEVEPITEGVANAIHNEIFWLHKTCNAEANEKAGIYNVSKMKELDENEKVKLLLEELKRGRSKS